MGNMCTSASAHVHPLKQTYSLPLVHRPKGVLLVCYLFLALGILLTKFGIAAVISSVSVADKAKNDVFDPWSDLALTCDLFKFFLISLKSTR